MKTQGFIVVFRQQDERHAGALDTKPFDVLTTEPLSSIRTRRSAGRKNRYWTIIRVERLPRVVYMARCPKDIPQIHLTITPS
jgi:hypothetical protein